MIRASVLIAAVLALGLPGCPTDCQQLQLAVDAACQNPDSAACTVAKQQLAGRCQPTPSPSPTPTPGPTPTPTPPPTPTPGPSGCLAPPEHPLEDWGRSYDPGVRPPTLTQAVQAAKAKVGERCGQNPEGTIEAVAAVLRGQGFCAGLSVDALSALSGIDGLWEEWHVVSYGDGCWTGSPYKGAHTYLKPWPPSGPAPTPTPTPTPAPTPTPTPNTPAGDTCETAPLPPLNDLGPSLFQPQGAGSAFYRVDLHPHVEDAAFCAAHGMGLLPDGVSKRTNCPPRQEGHPLRKCLDRRLVGLPAEGGSLRWENLSGGPADWQPENPFDHDFPVGQRFRVCSLTTPAVCAEGSLP